MGVKKVKDSFSLGADDNTNSAAMRNKILKNPIKTFSTVVGKLEGDKWLIDPGNGKLNAPYGIQYHLHKDRIEKYKVTHNKSNLSLDDYKAISLDLFNKNAMDIATKIPSQWNQVGPDGQFLLTSIKYNTNKVFTKLATSLVNYKKTKANGDLIEVFKNTRRNIKGVNTEGLDNRAIQELEAAGLFDSTNIIHQAIARQALPLFTYKRK